MAVEMNRVVMGLGLLDGANKALAGFLDTEDTALITRIYNKAQSKAFKASGTAEHKPAPKAEQAKPVESAPDGTGEITVSFAEGEGEWASGQPKGAGWAWKTLNYTGKKLAPRTFKPSDIIAEYGHQQGQALHRKATEIGVITMHIAKSTGQPAYSFRLSEDIRINFLWVTQGKAK
jgi:hypothetical protein